jgi:hypothetical protein
MNDVITGSAIGFVIACVFIAALFASSLSAVVYAVNKSNHDHYSQREDESDTKIIQLEQKVAWLERRLDEMTQEILRSRYDPKGEAVTP